MVRIPFGCALATLALVASISAHAQSRPFYQGKQLFLVINLSAGGPTDIEGRLVARHLGAHVAGNPRIVPRNMPGAGGMVAANWLGQVAATDGANLGFFTAIAPAAVVSSPVLKVDITKFAFVATGPGVTVTYIRKDWEGGIPRAEDLVKKPNFWIGGLAVESNKDLSMRLQLHMLQTAYRYVTGYPGAGDIRLALQRGEIQMTAESMPAYRAMVEPTLVNTGQVIPVWYDTPDQSRNPRPTETEGIPATTFYDFYRRVKGSPPSGPVWEAFDTMNTVARGFERMMVMAPGTSQEAVDALKAGVAALAKDEEFRKDAMKTMQFVPKYDTSARMETLYREKARPNPEVAKAYQHFIDDGMTSGVKK